MKWNKTSELLPENGLYRDELPYLVISKKGEYFLAYMYNNIWLDYETQNEVETPTNWTIIEPCEN